MSRYIFSAAIVLTVLGVQASNADIITDLGNAVILEEFLFGDPNGTVLTAVANNVTSNPWDEDSDTLDVATNGSGQLNASLKNNDGFGTNYVNNADIFANPGQRVFGVMEVTWDFDPNALDTSENEELRISLMQNDPRSSFVVAEFEIQREDDNTVTIFGNGVGSGSSDTASANLSLTQSTTFIGVVDADLSNESFEVHFSTDGGSNFTTLGGGVIAPGRDTIRGFRMVLNNNLADDNVLIDRVYLAKVPEPATMLLSTLGFLGFIASRRRS